MLILYEIYISVQIGTAHGEDPSSDFPLEILLSYLESLDDMNYFYLECDDSQKVKILIEVLQYDWQGQEDAWRQISIDQEVTYSIAVQQGHHSLLEDQGWRATLEGHVVTEGV